MKKICYIAVLLLNASTLFGQSTIVIRDAIKKENVVWYGLDFSNARFYGGFDHNSEVVNVSLSKWNDLIVSGFGDASAEYYSGIKRILKKSDLKVDLSQITYRNHRVKVNDLFALNDSVHFSLDTVLIKKMISNYNTNAEPGLGILLVVEFFEKSNEQVSGYLTIFRNDNKTVLYTKKFLGKAGGPEMDKHWARGIIDLLFSWAYSAGYSKDNSLLKKSHPDTIIY